MMRQNICLVPVQTDLSNSTRSSKDGCQMAVISVVPVLGWIPTIESPADLLRC